MPWKNRRIITHAEKMLLLNAEMVLPRGVPKACRILKSRLARLRRLRNKVLAALTKREICDCGLCRTCRHRAYMRSWRRRYYARDLYRFERAIGQQRLDALRAKV